MLKSVFIGFKNFFDLLLIDWLGRRTDLKYCFWTHKLSWHYSSEGVRGRRRKVIKYFLQRMKKYGFLRCINEIFYFLYYRAFIQKKDAGKLKELVKKYRSTQKETEPRYKEIFVDDIDSDKLVQIVKDNKIDIIFVTCTNTRIPDKLYSAPRLGTFLWHEGIVPEYKGLYSAFWALYNQDYHNLGYTLLKMGDKLDSGPIYVQGQVKDVDPLEDFWCYIGHKAIYDSLPEVEIFLKKLEASDLKEIDRGKVVSGFYSYPGFIQLISLLLRRKIRRARRKFIKD